jgi:hypothetical protein
LIFIDRSVPKGVADTLSCVRDDVVWLEPMFRHSAPESEWMPKIADNGWPAILRDKKIRTRPLERRTIFRSNLGCFVFGQRTNPTRWEYLKLLAKCLDEVEERHATTPRPFIYVIDRDGRLNFDEKFARMAARGWLA